jgi:alpha-tubulin suppressor-like RCC1 family protein
MTPSNFRRREVVQIACGYYHWLALVKQRNGKATEVYSLGCNGDGQLGLGDGANRKELSKVRPNRPAQNVYRPSPHTFASSFRFLSSRALK